ncbi:ParA family protein [Candidatus Uabimicrobium sp. HlEnr_7]|uniref:ParA family protein n=1 Tax=Candidatus Uabimicrobium helgolandensis TaxID=3095367 RepID=UPI0035579EE8
MIISVAIEKGGTGKSQTAVNLSCALVRFHKLKVLVVDLDPQGTASLGFGISPLSTDTNTIYDVLSGRVDPQDAVYSYNDSDLCIMPANHELAIYGSNEFTTELDNLLSPMSNIFDFIFIDLPPTLGNFTMTSLCLSDSVLIPVNASSSVCIVALLSQLRTIKTTVEAVNSKLSVLGVLACMVNNTRICSEVLSWLEDEYPNLLFETKIRQNIKLAESLGLGEPIFDYAPDSYGALDYKNVAAEIMRRVT